MQQLDYHIFQMTKDEFFYSFGEQTKHIKERIFLESGRGGYYSIAAWHPIATAKSIEDGLQITWQNGEVEMKRGEALLELEKLVKQYQFEAIPQLPDFQGGAVGFISYDYVRTIEVLPTQAQDDLQVPDLYFYLFDHWAVHDVNTNEVTLMQLPTSNVDLHAWQNEYIASCRRIWS